MRFSLIISSVLFLSSCGHALKKPESFSAKMDRYQAHQYSNNKVPLIELPQSVHESPVSRGPASVKPVEQKSLAISNKRLYFLTLHSQYESISSMVRSDAPKLNICPSFHTNLVKQQQGKLKITTHPVIEFSNVKYIDGQFNPELFLPITRNSAQPIVKDVVTKEGNISVEKALKIHLNKTYSELQELCEFGNSDNYYTFENLYTLIQRGEVHYKNDKVNALMKTTLFTNHILIKSLKSHNKVTGRFPAQVKNNNGNSFMKEVYKRFKSPIRDQQLDIIYAKRN